MRNVIYDSEDVVLIDWDDAMVNYLISLINEIKGV